MNNLENISTKLTLWHKSPNGFDRNKHSSRGDKQSGKCTARHVHVQQDMYNGQTIGEMLALQGTT